MKPTTNILLAAVAFVIGLGAFLWAVREPTEPLTADGLAAARDKWRQASIVDYDIRYRMHGSEYAVRARGGAVVEALVNGKPAMSSDLYNYGVEGLFEVLELELENLNDPNGPFASQAQNIIVRVRFNESFGYIERYLRSGGMGRGAGIELIEFTPLGD